MNFCLIIKWIIFIFIFNNRFITVNLIKIYWVKQNNMNPIQHSFCCLHFLYKISNTFGSEGLVNWCMGGGYQSTCKGLWAVHILFFSPIRATHTTSFIGMYKKNFVGK